MRIFKSFDTYNNNTNQPLWVTIGTFDGMHIGHRELLKQLCEYSHKVHKNARTLVITFDIHPQKILNGNTPCQLTSNKQKLNYIEDAGIDDCIAIDFTKDFANISADTFIEEILIKKLKIAGIIIGYNNRFGYHAKGDFKLLKSYANQDKFFVLTGKPFLVDGSPVSSSRIRELLRNLQFQKAESLLGRHFSIIGTVVKGSQIGREIGIPTANIEQKSGVFFPPGVFGVKVKRLVNAETQLFGVANIGFKPTIQAQNYNPQAPLLEVHILDFDGNLYGKELEIEFLTHIRDEVKFQNFDALKSQILADIDLFRKLLKENSQNID